MAIEGLAWKPAAEIGKIRTRRSAHRRSLLGVRCEVDQTRNFRLDDLAVETVATRMISRGLWNWEQALERPCIPNRPRQSQSITNSHLPHRSMFYLIMPLCR